MATLRDIADRLEISQTVVSRVLNGKSDVWASDLTRQRIFETARALNYRPNSVGRPLLAGQTMQIGVVLNQSRWASFEAGYIAELQGLASVVEKAKYNLMLVPGTQSRKTTIEDVLQAKACDGICIFGAETEPEVFPYLRESGLRCVVIGSAGDQFLPQVDHDNAGYIRTSLQWLANQGHQRIMLSHPATLETPAPHRVLIEATYHAVMEELGLQALPVFTPSADWHASHNLSLYEEYQPTAIVVRSLSMLLAWKSVLLGAGKRIPQDVTLLGHLSANQVKNLKEFHADAGLCCHLHDPQEVGKRAGLMLMDWLGGNPPPLEPVLVPSLGPYWCESH